MLLIVLQLYSPQVVQNKASHNVTSSSYVILKEYWLQLNGSVKEPNISIYFFPPITQWCSISNVLFTGGRGVSEFSVLKYY